MGVVGSNPFARANYFNNLTDYMQLGASVLARISHQTKCIGAANQRKVFCEKRLRGWQEFPDADRV